MRCEEGRTFNANWFEDYCIRVFDGKDLKKNDHFEIMGADEGITLKWLLKI
jgi:hypothetical protein